MILNKPHGERGCLFACMVAIVLLKNSQTLASTTSHTQDTNTQNQTQSIKTEANISFENSELQRNITESLDKISQFEKQLTHKPLSPNDRDKIMTDVKEILEQLEELSKSMKLNSNKIIEADRELFDESLQKIQKYLDVFQKEKAIDKKLDEFAKALEELSSKPFPLSTADRNKLKTLRESIAELRKNPFGNREGENPNEELQHRIAQKTKLLEDSLKKTEDNLQTLDNRDQTAPPSTKPSDETPTISRAESEGHFSQSSSNALSSKSSFFSPDLFSNNFENRSNDLFPSQSMRQKEGLFSKKNPSGNNTPISTKASIYNPPSSDDNLSGLNSNEPSPYSNVKTTPERSDFSLDKSKALSKVINPKDVYNPPQEEKPIGVFSQKNAVPAEIKPFNKATLLAPQQNADSKSNQFSESPLTNTISGARKNLDYATAPKFIEESSPSRGFVATALPTTNQTYPEPVAAKRLSINTPNQYSFNRDGTLSPIETPRKTGQNSPFSSPTRTLASLETVAVDNPQRELVPTQLDSETKMSEGKLVKQTLASSESTAASEILGLLNKSPKALRRPQKQKNNKPIKTISSAPSLITRVLSLLGL